MHDSHLVIDSGAFSAWSKGATIDLEQYTDFCLQHLDEIDHVVNLDVIPAKPGQKAISQAEIERSAALGWKNAEYMLSRGIPIEKLVHVFHQNENFKWLDRMVETFPCIGLSPANDRTTPEKQKWLDDCMAHVLDDQMIPRVKFHGFAVTSHAIMVRYPWYSVDSSTWCMMAGRGSFYAPRQTRDGWDYLARPITVQVSAKVAKGAFQLSGPVHQRTVREYLEGLGVEMGETAYEIVPESSATKDKLADGERILNKTQSVHRGLECPTGHVVVERVIKRGVTNCYHTRYWLNAEYLNRLQAALPAWPWAWKIKHNTFGI